MKKLLFTILTLSTLVPAFAYRIEYGRNKIISQPVYEDLYIVGGNITINAPIYGDLVIAGGTIVINDTVANDILLAGGTVTFNGFTGDDIRCVGGEIHIAKDVTGDVAVAGGRVTIDKSVVIGGLLTSGGTIIIDGNIQGELRGTFGELVLRGSVGGKVNCKAGSISIDGPIMGNSILSAPYIMLGSKAVFHSDVRYWSEQNLLDFSPYMKSGKATYDPTLRIRSNKWYYLGFTGILVLAWYLCMALLVIFIIQYLFSSTMSKAASTVFDHTLKSLGAGFLFLIAIPILAVVAFVTIVGVPVGILLVVGYISLLLLATCISAVVTTNWINNRQNNKWNNWRLGFVALGIFMLLKLISLIPVAGWLIVIVVVCLSFGSILINIRWKKRVVKADIT